MKSPIVMKKTCFVTLSIMVALALFVPIQSAQAASYTIVAPAQSLTVKLELGRDRQYDNEPFRFFEISTEGWLCSREVYMYGTAYGNAAEKAINQIRQINLLIQPLAGAQASLTALEKVLIQESGRGNPFTKEQVGAAVRKTIIESIKKAGFTSDDLLVQQAEYLSKIINVAAKSEYSENEIAGFFGYGAVNEDFRTNYGGAPGGVWKLSKSYAAEGTLFNNDRLIYEARNCYQKSDLSTMMNAVGSAAQKLQEAVTKFRDAKEKALATAAPIKK